MVNGREGSSVLPVKTIAGWPEQLVRDETENIVGDYGCAVFNSARTHRYLLERRWAEGHLLTWVMLNPSTATAFVVDPTIRRCIRFAQRDGYAGIKVVNLFALRATNPRELKTHPDPAGLCNDRILTENTQWAHVVAAWGAGGKLNDRDREVAALLAGVGADVNCLAVTKGGDPVHPLARGRSRVPDDAPFIPWRLVS